MIISSVSLTPATGCRVSVSYLHLNPNNTLVGLKHHFQKSTSLPSRVSTLEESWQQEHLYLYLMSLCLILCLDVSGFKLHLFVLVLTFTTRMRRLHLVLFPCKSAVIKSSLDLLSQKLRKLPDGYYSRMADFFCVLPIVLAAQKGLIEPKCLMKEKDEMRKMNN